jgi:hypothetical protein
MFVVDIPGVKLRLKYEQRLVLRNKIYLIKDESGVALTTNGDKVLQSLSSETEKLVGHAREWFRTDSIT